MLGFQGYAALEESVLGSGRGFLGVSTFYSFLLMSFLHQLVHNGVKCHIQFDWVRYGHLGTPAQFVPRHQNLCILDQKCYFEIELILLLLSVFTYFSKPAFNFILPHKITNSYSLRGGTSVWCKQFLFRGKIRQKYLDGHI